MKNVLFYIIFLFQFSLVAQSNLINNWSLEHWEDHKPSNWTIEKNTVDIFKSNYKLIPFGVRTSDLKFRSKFPIAGSHGLSYFGLAGDESISCLLENPLKANRIYEVSLYVYNPPIYTDRVTNKFTIKFQSEKGLSNPILLEHHTEIDTIQQEWVKVSRLIKGIGNEKRLHLGFFGEHYDDSPFKKSGLYYLFDAISIKELCTSIDTLNLFFDEGEYLLSNDIISNYITNNLNEKYNIKAVIEGYASMKGDKESNYELSIKRNNEVHSHLSKFNTIKIDSIIAKGETNRFSIEESSNRTVKIIFQYNHSCVNLDSVSITKVNMSLADRLKEMEESDQEIRIQLDSIINQKPVDSLLLKKIELKMNRLDSINQSDLFRIFETVGYPGLSLVGASNMDVAFLIMQHAPLKKRLQHESLLLKAVSEGEATKIWLPYLIDRNLVDQNKKQIYGTQLFWNEETGTFELFPIKNKNSVNQLRREFRLGKLEDYLKSFNSN